MTAPAPSLVWFRRDLRIADNPALRMACRVGPVVPVYLHTPDLDTAWRPGAASNWWLHHSLASLRESLRRRGSELVLRQGRDPLPLLRRLARDTGAKTVCWNAVPEPAARRHDAAMRRALQKEGFAVESHEAALLFDPNWIRNKQDRPFQVFTPFWRHCLESLSPEPPAAAPGDIPAPGRFPDGEDLDALDLRPAIDWADGFRETWEPGEQGALKALRRFIRSGLESYDTGRDRPDRAGTSRLSPHLHFGEISVRQVWQAVEQAAADRPSARKAALVYQRELGWREFAHHLLEHFPHTPDKPLHPEFGRFPWRRDAALLQAWQKGRTGYPIVDAGMRELWRTGWMHNRVRMIVASFLVKDMLLPWQEGARWFWDTLVDADLANNTLGWQWSAGCGADAAPYFRIFNPVLQAAKFDPEGEYIRRWVPELKALPVPWLFKPWEAEPLELQAAGVVLGQTYPRPVVDHAEARDRALAAYAAMKNPG